MRKHFSKLFVFTMMLLFILPICVKANEGDLRYEITNVELKDDKITFKGWAFIHRTNNYNTIEIDGQTIKSGGDQKILMRAVDSRGNEIKTIVVDGGSVKNYNFYCELFETSVDGDCSKDKYLSENANKCENNSEGNTKSINGISSQCYYEDMYFNITFDVSAWNYSDVRFQIAVSNADFEDRNVSKAIGNKYGNDYYTKFENVAVADAAIVNTSSKYIKIDESSISNTVEFIASHGVLFKLNSDIEKFYYETVDSIGTYGAWNDVNVSKICDNFYTLHTDWGNDGKSMFTNNGYDFLGQYFGTNYYAIKIKKDYSIPEGGLGGWTIACPGFGNVVGIDFKVALATGSHVKISGDNHFRIIIEKKNFCEVTSPSSGTLECNKSKTFNSECEKLTVVTSEGNAEVTIKQTGTISSVLTPESTYAGGGFNFGIMYYNTIKWDFVPGQNISNALRNKVIEAMNEKIKDYDAYVDGINITELKFNNELANVSMIKSCTSSSKNDKNYYGEELTVSCVFTFPEAKIDLEGNITYNNNIANLNINNKYYTPMNFSGIYNISAKIVGMDRITENAAKNDSKEKGVAWTGNWSDTFYNCQINLYTLIIGGNKFIYRPIDINNPFPDRNAGINWYSWYSLDKNKQRLKETYSKLQYMVTLDNKTITDIKNYNSSHNYLDWDSIDDVTKQSSFITEKDYIDRVGGN